MTCPVCGYRNLDSRATCRRCGAPLHGPTEKTLGADEPDDTGFVVDLDEADIAPRAPAQRPEPSPRRTEAAAPAAPPRPAPAPDPSAEALRARALTAGDRDPRHAPARPPEPPAVPPPAAQHGAPHGAPRASEPPTPSAVPPPVVPPVAPPPTRAPEPGPVRPEAGPVRPEAGSPRPEPGSLRPEPGGAPPGADTVAGFRRTPPPAASPFAPAASLGRDYAGFWIRLLAMVVDWTVILAVLVFTSIATMLVLGGPGAMIDPASATAQLGELRVYFGLFELALLAFYFTFFTWAAGGTPGKLVLRLKVVQADGAPVTGGRAFLRFLAYGIELIPGVVIAGVLWGLVAIGTLLLHQPLLSAVLGALATFLVFVGYVWAAFDTRKQAWHDKLAGTVVVRTG